MDYSVRYLITVIEWYVPTR